MTPLQSGTAFHCDHSILFYYHIDTLRKPTVIPDDIDELHLKQLEKATSKNRSLELPQNPRIFLEANIKSPSIELEQIVCDG